MKFGISQLARFEADYGTYSEVTAREFKDSQITATDDEALLLIRYFDENNIFRGSVKKSGGKSGQVFLLYPSGQPITLNLIFPKVKKSELRLYIRKRSGFKPAGGRIWFLFVKDGVLWIGSMSESEWRNESKILTVDDSDSFYQDAITESNVRIIKQSARDVYARSPAIALKVFEKSNYQCELDPSHRTFQARSSTLQYMEAHHLIPMRAQSNYQNTLDNIHNVFCLCPTCHRAIHYSVRDSTKYIIDKLIANRPETLELLNVTMMDLYNLYSVETID